MDSKQSSHPMMEYLEEINKKGLMVLDNVRNMPIYNEPITTPLMVLALNLQGTVDAECDMRPVTFHPHEIAVLPPRHILCSKYSSPNYQAVLIVMSPSFQEEMKRLYNNIYQDNFYYLKHPAVALNDDQFANVRNLFDMIRFVSTTDSANRWEMLGNLLNVLFRFLQDYRRQNGYGEYQPSQYDLLFNRFYQAITEHYTESHEVRFYAQLFCLTPKYFATIIKRHTKTKALDWINSYVLIQAKQLLRYQQHLSIQEIGFRLGFNEQASFSRFFRDNTGMSPKEYREQKQ